MPSRPHPALRRLVLAVSAAAALTAALPAAHAAWPPLDNSRLVEVQVIDRQRGDRAMPLVEHRGTTWVAGRPDDRYAVRLMNRTNARVMVVLSVDGVNAVTGETAATGQVGYVLAPWQTSDVTGWRKSDQETAAFYFTSIADSYAGRTARPQNVGVIGAAVFRERVVARPQPMPIERSLSGANDERFSHPDRLALRRGESSPSTDRDMLASRAAPPPASPAPSARDDASDRSRSATQAEITAQAKSESRLGTGHGERVWSPIRHTTFERASSSPAEVVQIRYDSHANLVAAGVLPSPRPQPRPFPNPFPGYAPDPA